MGEHSNKLGFNKLSPKNDVSIDIYNDAFDFVFNNNDILNIALTGPYSSGKSTIFLSYENSDKGKDKTYLHISLADFTGRAKKEELLEENKLEGRIINQLLYQIDSKNIPDSKFRIKISKEYDSFITGIVLSILSFGLGINIFHDFFLKWARELYYKPIQSVFISFVNPYVRIIALIISIIIIVGFMVRIIVERKLLPLVNKISILDTSLELFPNNDDSLFDKYKDEIIYIIENSNADVIVFEDIDRFDDIEIFERLREINWLLNVRINASDIRRNNIRFFYLIKDEIFTSTDRTKFFDFIIPIVPVMSGTNAYDIMIENLRNCDFINKIDIDFLKGLCVFIDEKRLIDNIYNEYIIYTERLKDGPLDYNKLLALIAYKNIFPKDFNDLYNNVGFIADIFKCKEKIIESIEKLIDEKIKEVQSNLKEENAKKEEAEARSEKYINEQIVDTLNNNIILLQQKKIELSSRNLSEIITSNNISFWKVLMNVKVNDFDEQSHFGEKYSEIIYDEKFPFVQYLLREGKIDENHKYFMNVFYGKDISGKDFEFIESTYDAKAKKYDYNLDSPEKVAKQLEIKRFERIEILNFSLFEHLLKYNKKNKEKLNTFIKTIQRENCLEFLEEFFRKTNNKDTLVKSINDIWLDCFDTIMESWSEQNILEFSLLMLKTIDKKLLVRISNKTKLTEYISSQSNYLQYVTDSEKQIESMKNIGVSFKKINIRKYKKSILYAVYKSNMYVLNLQNVRIMLNQIEKQMPNNYDKGKVLSCIFNLKERDIYKYMIENFDSFMNHLFEIDYMFKDNDETIEQVLNSEIIDAEVKQGYINSLYSKISLLEMINEPVYRKELIQNNCVGYRPENVFVYYLDFGWDDILENFINSDMRRNMKIAGYDEYVGRILNDNVVNNTVHYTNSQEVYRNLFTNIVFSKNLSLKKYDCLLNNLSWYYDSIQNLNSIEPSKINVLIKNKNITFTKENLLAIRKDAPDNLVLFIKQNIKKYVEAVKNRQINGLDIPMVLSFNDSIISDEDKVELLSHYGYSVKIKDEYSHRIKNFIIKNNFDNDDLSYVYANYSDFDSDARAIIQNKAVNNIASLTSGKNSIDNELLEELICNSALKRQHKIALFKNYINKINMQSMYKYLCVLDYSNLASIFSTNREPVKLTDDNIDMIKFLKQSKIIKRYVLDEKKGVIKGIQVYK